MTSSSQQIIVGDLEVENMQMGMKLGTNVPRNM